MSRLIEAIEKSDIESVKTIVAGGGVDMNGVDERDWTALMYAVRYGFVDCAKVLLDVKADINKADGHGVAPLHYALFRGHLGCVNLLITRGANVNARDRIGSTPLHYAASAGLVLSVDELIRVGAELDEGDEKGRTPLVRAIICNSRDCAERLLDAGAKLSNVPTNTKIPNWFLLLLARRKRVKETLVVLFKLSHRLIGKDVAKIIISTVWETRDFPEWENKVKKSKN
jgi:ankyrin repeat protein